ncbi:MAG: hypothetical protein ACR2MW_04270 [Chthoniobacterales bacterium]
MGTDHDKGRSNVSTPKNNKAASAGESEIPKPKRSKDKLLRLDDLIPKKNVSGGRQLLFGATDINQTKHNRKRS